MASTQKYKTKKGTRWRVQYRGPDGRSHTKTGFPTKTAAQNWAAANTTAITSGRWSDPATQRLTLTDLWPTWLATKHDHAQNSLTAWENAWRRHIQPRWGHVRADDITPHAVQAWYGSLPVGPSAIYQIHAVLSGLCELAVDERAIAANPMRRVKRPRRAEPRHVFLTAEQLWRLAGMHRDPLVVLTLGTVGLRIGELAGLQVGDLSEVSCRLSVRRAIVWPRGGWQVAPTKTRKARVVAVPEVVMGMLRDRAVGRPHGGWLFPSVKDHSAPAQYRTEADRFRRTVEAAMGEGVLSERVTLHGLRHAAAGLLVHAGASVKAVQRQLGHASAAMTLDVYAELFDDDLDGVAAALDGELSRVVKLSSSGGDGGVNDAARLGF